MSQTGPAVDLAHLARLAEAFEAGAIDPAGFHHREHMLVALWLLAHHPPDAAVERMRAGLHRVLARIGRDAYHETITVFWMHVLGFRLALADPAAPLDTRLALVLDWCDAARPLQAHYSSERLSDPAARTTFLEPDLAPLPRAAQTPGS